MPKEWPIYADTRVYEAAMKGALCVIRRTKNKVELVLDDDNKDQA